MKYVPVIGLEIHAELTTRTKAFCGCLNRFGGEENSAICPNCMGLPGSLPSLNKRAVEYAVTAGLALNCEISRKTTWDRKNYFYPDLPKAYQLSQLYAPVCVGGGLQIGERFIRLNHIHLEEDAAKLIHDNLRGVSRVDYNRGAVPLIEIVTEPDMRSPEEAVAFVEQVRQVLMYAGVCDGRMEQGSVRMDANISIMPEGSEVFGTRVEIKNLNSFRHAVIAMNYEIERQTGLLESGGAVIQETRRFVEEQGITLGMRTKENAQDYRYFPDPDILPLEITEADIERIRSGMDETPMARRERYLGEYGISEEDAATILSKKFVSDFYDAVVAQGIQPKAAANMVRGEIMRCVNNLGLEELAITPEETAKLITMTSEGKITATNAKKAISAAIEEGCAVEDIIKKHDMLVEEDTGEIDAAIKRALESNPEAVQNWLDGEQKVFGFFMGQCNRELKGKASPQSVKSALEAALNALKG